MKALPYAVVVRRRSVLLACGSENPEADEGVSKSNLSEVRWKLIRFQRMEVNGQ